MDSIKDVGKGNVTSVPANQESPVDEELEKEDSGKQSIVSKVKEKIEALTEDKASFSESEEEKTDTAKVIKP